MKGKRKLNCLLSVDKGSLKNHMSNGEVYETHKLPERMKKKTPDK